MFVLCKHFNIGKPNPNPPPFSSQGKRKVVKEDFGLFLLHQLHRHDVPPLNRSNWNVRREYVSSGQKKHTHMHKC
jgi:hypothetical protein